MCDPRVRKAVSIRHIFSPKLYVHCLLQETSRNKQGAIHFRLGYHYLVSHAIKHGKVWVRWNWRMMLCSFERKERNAKHTETMGFVINNLPKSSGTL